MGEFAQFRIAGSGAHDDNLKADISSAKYSIQVKSETTTSETGMMDLDGVPFDVFVFTSDEDYNCFVEQSTLFKLQGSADMCDFVGRDGSTVQEQVTSWSSEDSDFLHKDQQTSDILVVIDNTNYMKAFSNKLRTDGDRDVTYSLQIETNFVSNDLYRTVMMGFVITFAALLFTIILNMCLYRLQRRSYNQVMQSKREIRRI